MLVVSELDIPLITKVVRSRLGNLALGGDVVMPRSSNLTQGGAGTPQYIYTS